MRKRIVRAAGIARQRLAERMHKRRKTLAEWQQKVVDPNEVARRISWIWGVPVKELMPREITTERLTTHAGEYYYGTHEFAVKKSLENEPTKSTKRHETMHGLHAVLDNRYRKEWLSPRTRKLVFALGMNPKIIQKEMAEELVAETAEKPKQKITHLNRTAEASWSSLLPIGAFSLLTILHPAAGYAGLVFTSKIAGRQIEFWAQRGSMQRIYGKHGVDGLILFMAAPPKVFGAIEMRLWERKMKKQGILAEEGGLTKAGIEFLRKRLPKKEIAGRLEEMKAQRRKRESIDRLRQRAGK